MGNHPSKPLGARPKYTHILPFVHMSEAFQASERLPGLLMPVLGDTVVECYLLTPGDLAKMEYNQFPGSRYWCVFVTRAEIPEALRWELLEVLGIREAIFNARPS